MIPELIFVHEQNENIFGELLPGWGDLLFKCHLKFLFYFWANFDDFFCKKAFWFLSSYLGMNKTKIVLVNCYQVEATYCSNAIWNFFNFFRGLSISQQCIYITIWWDLDVLYMVRFRKTISTYYIWVLDSNSIAMACNWSQIKWQPFAKNQEKWLTL